MSVLVIFSWILENFHEFLDFSEFSWISWFLMFYVWLWCTGAWLWCTGVWLWCTRVLHSVRPVVYPVLHSVRPVVYSEVWQWCTRCVLSGVYSGVPGGVPRCTTTTTTSPHHPLPGYHYPVHHHHPVHPACQCWPRGVTVVVHQAPFGYEECLRKHARLRTTKKHWKSLKNMKITVFYRF